MSDAPSVLSGTTAKEIAWSVGAAIREGRLGAGTRLPPVRAAAAQLQVAPATVSAAWALLSRAGLISTDGRRGTTVSATGPTGPRRYRRALDRESGLRLDLSTGVTDPMLLPNLAASLKRMGRIRVASSYLDEPTLPELETVLRNDWPYSAERFTVLDGAMDAMDYISRAFLRFGDRVAVEQPAFPPLLDLLDSVGVQLVAVEMDEQGLRPDSVRTAIEQGVRALFFQPRVQNPTGVSVTRERADALASVLEATPDVLIVEDDSAGPLARADAMSLGGRLPQRTLHVRSFSKSYGPDLRLAAVSGPESLLRQIANLRFLGQGWSSRILQSLLVDLLIGKQPQQQIAAAQVEYGRRLTSLVEALRSRGVHVSADDGLNVWVPVANETAALVYLASHGIGAAAGSAFWISGEHEAHIRVTAGLVREDAALVAEIIAHAAIGVGTTGPG